MLAAKHCVSLELEVRPSEIEVEAQKIETIRPGVIKRKKK